MTEPQQGASYETLLHIAHMADTLGFDGFFCSDHYLRIPQVSAGDSQFGPVDAWTVMAGLARETSIVKLGVLMSAATFRHPSQLAVQVAQVDQMSNGRVAFGLGTGWYEAEHVAYGIPFPVLRERFERYVEQIQIITGLWSAASKEKKKFEFNGTYYQLNVDSPFPAPRQSPRPPLILGGKGEKRTPAIAARYADEFNVPSLTPQETALRIQRVHEACGDLDRSADEVTCSVTLVICVGKTEGDARRRAASIGRDPDELRRLGIFGTPTEALARIESYSAVGAQCVYLKILDLYDMDHLTLISEEIAPHLR